MALATLPYFLMPCDDAAIRKQIVGHGADWLLHPLTLAVVFRQYAGIFILGLGSTDD